LKYENVYLKGYNVIKEAREGINQYIEIYNSQRVYSIIGYKTLDMIYYNLSNEMLGSKIYEDYELEDIYEFNKKMLQYMLWYNTERHHHSLNKKSSNTYFCDII